MNLKHTRKIAFAFLLSLPIAFAVFLLSSDAAIAYCRTSSGTITETCAWNNNLGRAGGDESTNTIRGIIELSGGVNTSTIRVESGASLVVHADETVVVGTIDLSGESGSIHIFDGGELKPGGIVWFDSTQCDNNGVFLNAKVSRTQPSGYVSCDNCAASDWECVGMCQRRQLSGGCESDWEYENMASGNYCSGGGVVSGTCSQSYSCDGTCRRAVTHYNCDGSGSCSSYAYGNYENAPEGMTCVSGGTWDAGICSTGSWVCEGSCQRSKTEYICNGSGSCSTAYNVLTSNISANHVCSSGSETTGYCSYGSWFCANSCTSRRIGYRCNGSGSCSYNSGYLNTYCSSNRRCDEEVYSGQCGIGACASGYECISGVCQEATVTSCTAVGGTCRNSRWGCFFNEVGYGSPTDCGWDQICCVDRAAE